MGICIRCDAGAIEDTHAIPHSLFPPFRPRKVATLGAIMVFDKHDSKSALVSLTIIYQAQANCFEDHP